MPRIVSVWLPQWPVQRWLAAERRRPARTPVDPDAPFVLADGSQASRIAAVNPAAAACGLAVGETLADARARIGALQVRRASPAADAAALTRLARWATRYTPSVALFGAESGHDGFFLDVTGATHLFGGEDEMLADLARRLAAFGLSARLAMAETAGTAWAVSHQARARRTTVPAGAEAHALAPLPVEALRLSHDTALTLRRLGFKRIGSLIGTPRAPFAARFEKELLLRLDRALGHAPEPLALLAPPPVYRQARTLLEPIATEDAIVTAATRLMHDLVPKLEADGMGARRLRLGLVRVDGAVQEIDVAVTLPTRSPAHVARLIGLKLERVTRTLETGFGFETISLAVTTAASLTPQQNALAALSAEAERTKRHVVLLDALRQRLGPASVRHLHPVASHWPERSQRTSPTAGPPGSWTTSGQPRPRPPLLLAQPEPAAVIALLPDGPPQHVRWRGERHVIAHAEGPERIAAEWWRNETPAATRDYYVAEDSTGRRFWLYREGIPGRETATPRWFVHGLFA